MIIDRSKQQKNLLEMLQEKNEYISAPCNGNGICGKCIVRYKSGATELTRRDREVFSEKQLEDGYRLACQSHPVGAYEVELPESEETIEVLSEWEKQQKTDTEGLTEAYTQTPAYRTKKQQRERQKKQKMQFMESASTSAPRLWQPC